MKKAFKIILIIIAVLFVLIFAALKIAPSYVKDYIVAHSKEYIGRQVNIGSVSLNPLTFSVTVDKFALLEQDDKTPFVSFDRFRINVDPLRIVTKTAAVSEIYMNGLYVHVIQNGTRFNFSDILDFLAESNVEGDSAEVSPVDTAAVDSATGIPNAAEIAQGLPVAISIKNIVFEKGNIIYEDQKIGSKVHLQDFSLDIPAVYLSNNSTDVGVSFKFADGGDLNVKVNANMATYDFHVDVDLNKFALAVGKPYLNDFINYKDFNGQLNTHIEVDGNIQDPLASNVKGIVALDSIVLTETSEKTIGVNHVGVGIARANLNENYFEVDSVIVDGAFAHLDLLKGGKTNIDILLAPKKATPDSISDTNTVVVAVAEEPKDSSAAEKSPEQATAPAKKMEAVVKKLLVQKTKVSANDLTISKPFSYTVSGITVSGTNVTLDKPCTVNVSAAFPEGGSLSVKYKGSVADLGTMDAYISVKNLALKHFSPYSLHFTGYPISAGTMAFASENKIKNFELDSKNTIDIYNIDVGDKDPNVDPEFTVPMKVGLYILKDKDDKIQFDVPVKGNMKDPQFSVLKIVWQTVMNLIVKVALSPLKIVGNMASAGAGAVGIDMGKNDEVLVDATSATFTSEQYAKATKMLEALKQDPKLSLTYTQYYNPKKTAEEYKIIKLKTEFYKQRENKQTLNEIDQRAILEIKDSDEGFAAYEKENATKIDVKILKQELAALAEKRNQDLLKVLQQQNGVTKKNVKVLTAPGGALNGHKGKPMYKISVDIQ